MSKKGIGEGNLAHFWGLIKEHFGIKIDAITISLFSQLGWTATSDSTEASDWTVDSTVESLFESLGWEEE